MVSHSLFALFIHNIFKNPDFLIIELKSRINSIQSGKI